MSKIKIVYRNVDDLIGAEYNPRQITEKQFNDLCDSIKRFGFKDPIIINKHKDRENIIVAGHQRLRVAKHLGFEQVPTVEVSLTLDQEKEFNVRHNKNTGSFDLDVLANEFEIDNLLEWGFEDWELGVPDFEMEEEEEQESEQEKPNTKSLTFKLHESEYDRVVELLKTFNENKELALFEALGLNG